MNDPTSIEDSLTAAVRFRRRSHDSPLWTQAAPADVIRHSLAGNKRKEWLAWTKHLAKRRSPIAATGLRSFDTAEILQWGSPPNVDPGVIAAIVPSPDKRAANDGPEPVLEAIAINGAAPLREDLALAHLACAYELPALAASLAEGMWWELLAQLHRTARDASALDLSAQPLLHQWLAGELALVLARLFPEISPCAELLPQARRALSAGLAELLDGKGVPHCRYLALQQPLAACWTRARMLDVSPDDAVWDDEAEAQYPLVVRAMLRWARADGSSVFAQAPVERRSPAAWARFFAAAVQLAGNDRTYAALRNLEWKGISQRAPRGGKGPPSPANHSEWAQLAMLRPDWRRSSPRLGISYDDRTFRGELTIGRDRIFAGDWRFTCLADENEARPAGDWEPLCWVSDEDVDYLELEIRLSEGLRIQRQICLARKDQFLFIADAVLGNESRTLHHKLTIPFAPEVSPVAAEESREVALAGRKPRGLVLPLALPEWRIDRRCGELATSGGAIVLEQTARGNALYAPLWIDLDPDRHDKPFTWRQLTVAQERQIQPRDVAAGYRVQFGKRQWLVYRSLSRAANRTVLGHNLATEFLIARFGRDGGVTTLIEVE